MVFGGQIVKLQSNINICCFFFQAVHSFSRAVHLNPGDKELWVEDLLWAQSLLEKRKNLESEKQEASDSNSRAKITELNPDSACDDNDESLEKQIDVYKHGQKMNESVSDTVNTGNLPSNYIQMRDYMPP